MAKKESKEKAAVVKAAATKKKSGPRIAVKATEAGYYELKRRKEGDVFPMFECDVKGNPKPCSWVVPLKGAVVDEEEELEGADDADEKPDESVI